MMSGFWLSIALMFIAFWLSIAIGPLAVAAYWIGLPILVRIWRHRDKIQDVYGQLKDNGRFFPTGVEYIEEQGKGKGRQRGTPHTKGGKPPPPPLSRKTVIEHIYDLEEKQQEKEEYVNRARPSWFDADTETTALCPDQWLGSYVYGIPPLTREEIREELNDDNAGLPDWLTNDVHPFELGDNDPDI